jgi:predicted nuclease of predicted toxin-antitoxin system
MRVLLDEHLNWRLTRYFDSDFQVTTVLWRGWSGKQNGELLQEAEAEFDVLVTMDKSIEHQQNLSHTKLAIIVIEAISNRLADVLPAMPEVNGALQSIQPGQVIHVTAD